MSRVHEEKLVYHYGDTFDDYVIDYVDEAGVAIDLTGYTARMKIKLGATTALTLTSSTNDGITLDGAAGRLTFSGTPTKMKSGSLTGGNVYQYDLEVSLGSITKTLIKGEFWVDAEITD